MNAGSLNILAVDDEKSITASIRFVLKRQGHTVDAVSDGADALARLAELPGHYDILITDHAMCKVSGLELLTLLPVNTFKGKIVVLSGYLTLELEAKYRSLGAHRIIRKPFELDELRQAVEELRPLQQT